MTWFRRFLCWVSSFDYFFFHRLEVIETYDENNRKLRCVDCGGYFIMNDTYKSVLPWDATFEHMVQVMYQIPRSKV